MQTQRRNRMKPHRDEWIAAAGLDCINLHLVVPCDKLKPQKFPHPPCVAEAFPNRTNRSTPARRRPGPLPSDRRGRVFGSLVVNPTVALVCVVAAQLFILLPLSGNALGANAEAETTPVSPQQFYNQGTAKFREGKLREAESALQLAVVSQTEKVQAAAVYNLGIVLLEEGFQNLKGGQSAKPAVAGASRACEDGQ